MNLQYLIKSKLPHILLSLSMGFFLLRGIRYALIGSYLPLSFILVCLLTIPISIKFRQLRFVLIRLWAALLLLWGVIRVLIPILFYFSPQVTEAHIRDQFTIIYTIISMCSLAFGIYFWRKAKNIGLNRELNFS